MLQGFDQGPFTAMRSDKGWAEQDIHSSKGGFFLLGSRPLSRRTRAPRIVLIRVDQLYNIEQKYQRYAASRFEASYDRADIHNASINSHPLLLGTGGSTLIRAKVRLPWTSIALRGALFHPDNSLLRNTKEHPQATQGSLTAFYLLSWVLYLHP